MNTTSLHHTLLIGFFGVMGATSTVEAHDFSHLAKITNTNAHNSTFLSQPPIDDALLGRPRREPQQYQHLNQMNPHWRDPNTDIDWQRLHLSHEQQERLERIFRRTRQEHERVWRREQKDIRHLLTPEQWQQLQQHHRWHRSSVPNHQW